MSEIANNRAEFLLHPGVDAAVSDAASHAAAGSSSERLVGAPADALSGEHRALPSTGVAQALGVSRRFLLGGGIAVCYILFFLAVLVSGQLQVGGITVALVFGAWLLGCAFAVRTVPRLSGLRASARGAAEGNRAVDASVDGVLAVWGNIGVVVAATLFGDELRLPLLSGVIFGVLYSGLQFSENRVRQVILATLVAYLACVALKAGLIGLDTEFELLCASGFAVQLLIAGLITREVIRLRLQAQARNRQLSRALRRVEELALRDELTGLYNRRHLLDFVGRAIATRERGGPSFTLAYCDLDHFKRVNDRFGHECGDQLLCGFAAAALASVRANDLVARLGGEEFVLVLVDADVSTASDIVERLRMRTANLQVADSDPEYRVTLSAGLASHTEDDTVDSILRRSDGALYQAKDLGRDQLVTA